MTKKKHVQRGVMIRVDDYVPLPELVEEETDDEEELKLRPDELKPIEEEPRNSIAHNGSNNQKSSALNRSSFYEKQRSRKSTIHEPRRSIHRQQDANAAEEGENHARDSVTLPRLPERNSIVNHNRLSRRISFHETAEAKEFFNDNDDRIQAIKELDDLISTFELSTVANKVQRRKIKVYKVPKAFQKLAAPRTILKPEPIPEYKFVAPKRKHYRTSNSEIRFRRPPCPMELKELTLWIPIESRGLISQKPLPATTIAKPIDKMIKQLQIKHEKLPGIVRSVPLESGIQA
jgi:hypothetical protein